MTAKQVEQVAQALEILEGLQKEVRVKYEVCEDSEYDALKALLSDINKAVSAVEGLC